jgi:hypothetical protein
MRNYLDVKDTPKRQKTLHERQTMRGFEEMGETLKNTTGEPRLSCC